MTPFTFIYSHTSIEPFKKLVNKILELNECDTEEHKTVDDVFFYDVFCEPCTYIKFPWIDYLDEIDVPEKLLYTVANNDIKLEFINDIMYQVMSKQIEKPEWMILAEQEACEDGFINLPSTFLFICPKDAKYEKLGEVIKTFLYSPSTITELKNI